MKNTQRCQTIKQETIQQFKQNTQNITTKKQAKHFRTIHNITQSKTIQNVPRKKKNASTTKTKKSHNQNTTNKINKNNSNNLINSLNHVLRNQTCMKNSYVMFFGIWNGK